MINNVVFDIGNVLIEWQPMRAVQQTFPHLNNYKVLTQTLFHSPIWFDLNLGKITLQEAIALYSEQLAIEQGTLQQLMQCIHDNLTPVLGSFELVEELYAAKVPLYSITDNVKEIVEHLKQRYDFWQRFQGVTVSADIGVMKPSADIYHHLLTTHNLNAAETIFFDDVLHNVQGATQVGMHSQQFSTAAACRKALVDFGVLR